MTSYLGAIGTANPAHRIASRRLPTLWPEALQFGEDDTRKLRALYRVSGIAHRYSVLPDYGRANGELHLLPEHARPGALSRAWASAWPCTAARRCPWPLAAVRDCLRQVPDVAPASLRTSSR